MQKGKDLREFVEDLTADGNGLEIFRDGLETFVMLVPANLSPYSVVGSFVTTM